MAIAKEAKINRAEEAEPKTARGKPAGGGVMDGGHPATAVSELKAQHPHSWSERGPFHGGSAHDRHEPLHGLHPKSRHGR